MTSVHPGALDAHALQATLAATLEASPDFVGLAAADGRVLFINDAGRKLVGLALDEDVASLSADTFHSAEVLRVLMAEAIPVALREGRWEGESELRTRAGEDIPVSMAIVALYDEASGESDEPRTYTLATVMRDLRRRVKIEEAVRASEAITRSILDASPSCMKTLDLDGRLEAMNAPGMCLMEVDDFTGLPGADWPAFWREGGLEEQARSAVAAARAGGQGRFHGFCRTMKGTPKWWDVIVSPILGAAGTPTHLLVDSRDVTAQRHADEIRERERDFLAAVLENLTDGVVACDPAGRLTLFNRATREFHGLPEEKIPPEQWAEHYALFEADGVTRLSTERVPLYRALQGEEVHDAEIVIAPVDRTARHVLASGRQLHDAEGRGLGAVVVMHDVTEARRALASERRFREILEAVRSLSICLDVAGRLTFCNDALLQLTGWTRDEVLNTDWFARFVPAGHEVGAVFARAMADDTLPVHSENEILTRDGERRLVSWDNATLYDASGAIVGSASIGQDLTERRQLEEQLRQAQKLEVVGQLAGGVAHDFNNLLTAISCSAEFLREGLPAGSALGEDVERIADATERAASLTRQLLAFGRRQMIQPSPSDPARIVTALAGMFDRVLGSDIDLRLKVDPAAGHVLLDPTQFEQIVANLALNARDAMPHGGRLDIKTEARTLSLPQPHEHGVIAPGDYVVVTVRDAGTGMSESTRARIFEPFFTTKGPGQGTGLGLSTVYGIVKEANGHVLVRSIVGEGTTFIVYLPRLAPDNGDPGLDGYVTADAAGAVDSHPPVLVVDDEHAVRRVMMRVVARLGYRAIPAGNGPDALLAISRLQQEEGILPRLVVTDLVMPGMSGRELGDALAGQFPGLPVLYVSGFSVDDAFRRELLDAKRPFLQKPFTLETLESAIRAVVG